MIKVTMQTNVLVYIPLNDCGTYFTPTITYEQFKEWVEAKNIKEFVFRPCDFRDDHEYKTLYKHRVAMVEALGFTVTESGTVHHYLKASK